MTEKNPGHGKCVVLLFSGGLDTTLEAVERLSTHDVVHLLTFDNGWCVNVDSARRRAEELRGLPGGNRIRHAWVDTKPLLKRLLLRVRSLPQAPTSPLVADLVCKMAAAAELVAYARRNGVTEVSDGAAGAQTQIFIQHPEFTSHVEPLLASYGLTPLPPVRFGETRDEKLSALDRLGLRSGPRFLESLHITSQLRHQPFCLRGILTFFFTSPTRHLGVVKKRGLSIPEAKALWDALLPAAVEYLRETHGLTATEEKRQT